MRRVRRLCALWFCAQICLFSLACEDASAQLAGSFLNVTGITTRVLPNAVKLIINTDGAVSFGGDLNEWVDYSTGFNNKSTQSFRIRVVNARAQIPAYIPVSSYPLSAVRVTPGREPIGNPFFNGGVSPDTDPRVDLELLFDVPINVRRFSVDRGRNVTFSQSLGPREVSVELGQDRRSIVVTVVPDRTDTGSFDRLNRSPFDQRKQALEIIRDGQAYRVSALNAPLAKVLTTLSQASGRSFSVRPGSAGIPVSLSLPAASIDDITRALQLGYGLEAHDSTEGLLFDRSENVATERFPLTNLRPDRARLLLPDFLLPSLRADIAGNALIASASPSVLQRVREDLRLLDVPRAQIRVAVEGWEVSSAQEANEALRLARVANGYDLASDTALSTMSVGLGPEDAKSFRVSLSALERRGRARLTVSPFLTLLQGERGTLFLGQQRYIKVLQQNGGDQILTALPLSIGYSLDVTARSISADSISLDIAPRISTVDSTEASTGLPTLGIREIQASVQLNPGGAAVIAGLDLDLDNRSRQPGPPLSKRADVSHTKLIILVTASLV